MIELDTTNILFICGGAFIGIDDIIKSRVDDSSIGFNQDTQSTTTQYSNMDAIVSQVNTEDLTHFGFVPEFIGRLPIVTILQEHSIETLYKILHEPHNAIVKQFVHFFNQNNITLEFEKKALYAVAEEAHTHNTGARGLRSIVENLLLDTMFEVPSNPDITKIIITEEHVREKTQPQYIYKTPSKAIENAS